MKVIMTVVLCLSLLGLVTMASAQIPAKLSYQGVLADNTGTPVPNGNYNLTLSIYDVLTGGSALWTEGQLVNVTNGMFNVILGSASALNLPFNQPYYLGVSVGGGTELAPRTLLTASPYGLNALHAMRADTAQVAMAAVLMPFSAFGGSGSTTALGTSWTNYTNDTVRINCPGPGTLVATSTAWMLYSHAAAEDLSIRVAHGLSATTGPTSSRYTSAWDMPANMPVVSGGYTTVPVQSQFAITSAGPVTVYLNGYRASGTSVVDFYYANTVVTFYPAPPIIGMQSSAPFVGPDQPK
jgi:hypothetical protein